MDMSDPADYEAAEISHDPALHSPQAEAGADQSQGAVAPPDRDSNDLTLPIARIKRIIKHESDVRAVSQEAIYAIGKATEMMLEDLIASSAESLLAQQRKTLTYSDVSTAVQQHENLDFLRDIVPSKVLVAQLLEELQQQRQDS